MLPLAAMAREFRTLFSSCHGPQPLLAPRSLLAKSHRLQALALEFGLPRLAANRRLQDLRIHIVHVPSTHGVHGPW